MARPTALIQSSFSCNSAERKQASTRPALRAQRAAREGEWGPAKVHVVRPGPHLFRVCDEEHALCLRGNLEREGLVDRVLGALDRQALVHLRPGASKRATEGCGVTVGRAFKARAT